MRRIAIGILMVAGGLLACNSSQNKAAKLVGSWHAVKLENPQMDSFFQSSQAYIDTVGKGHDAALNMQLYGVANMDSMRTILQQQFEETRNIQMNAVTNTVFNFRKDSLVVISFNGNVDSSKWYFDKTGALILNEISDSGKGDKAKLEVVSLTDTVLKLRFQENGSNSVVTFHPEGK